MKTKQELYKSLRELNITTVTYSHHPLYSVDQAKSVISHLPGGHCKNLFLKDKNAQFWLITAIDDTKIDLKAVSQSFNAPKLSFASEDILYKYLGVKPGSVTPLGLFNDKDQNIKVILDYKLFENEIINMHPLGNDETIALNPRNLIKFINYCKNVYYLYNFKENKIEDI